MEKDKVLQWLTKSKSTIEPSKYDEIRKDVYQLDSGTFMDKWDSYLKDNVSGWIDLRKPKEKELQVRLREDFGDIGFNPSEIWKNEVYKKNYSDIPREKFEENLAKMKEYSDEYEKEKIENQRRRERIKEMEDTPWYKNILMNEYSKQRYIEDPDASIWGKQGKFNPYSKEGQAELADNILHFTSLVPDTYPGMIGPGKVAYSTLGGPVTRSLRNLIVDSDIKEDRPFAKFAEETALNVGTSFAPTMWINAVTKRGKNIAKSAGYFDDIALKKSITEEGKAIDTGLKTFTEDALDKMDYTQIAKNVNKLPESSLKNQLNSVIQSSNFDKDEIGKIVKEYRGLRATSPERLQEMYDDAMNTRDFWKKFAVSDDNPATYELFYNPDYGTLANPVTKPYASRMLLDPQFGKMGQLGYRAVTQAPVVFDMAARNIAQGKYEGEPVIDYDEETIIETLSPKWERGFVPKKGDKYYEIYEKWNSERNEEK